MYFFESLVINITEIAAQMLPVGGVISRQAAVFRVLNGFGKVGVHDEVEHIGNLADLHLRTGEPDSACGRVADEGNVYVYAEHFGGLICIRNYGFSIKREGDVHPLPAVCKGVDFACGGVFDDRFALINVFAVGYADERALLAFANSQARGLDVCREGVVYAGFEQLGRGCEYGFAFAALDHLCAADGHAKIGVVQREHVRRVALGLRPAGVEVAVFDAVDNGLTHSALIGRRIFNTRVVFCTISIPYLVIHVYHVAGGIEGIGIEGQKKPTAQRRGQCFCKGAFNVNQGITS